MPGQRETGVCGSRSEHSEERASLAVVPPTAGAHNAKNVRALVSRLQSSVRKAVVVGERCSRQSWECEKREAAAV